MTKISDVATASRLAAVALAVALVPVVAWSALPCEADIAKFCSDVPLGGGRIQACLQKHEKQLSADCKARHKDLEQEIGRAAASCRYDIMRFCSDVSPGQGRVAGCLQDNRDDLSPVCRTQLQLLNKPAGK